MGTVLITSPPGGPRYDGLVVQRLGLGALEVLSWEDLSALGVSAIATATGGGVSTGPYQSLNLGLHVGDDPDAVLENRRRAAAALGLELDDLVVADQVHGAGVARVGLAERGRGARTRADALEACDAMVTAEPGVGLLLLTADCVGVLLVDPDTPQIAVLHAGWRGAAAGVVAATVAELVAGGAAPSRLRAKFGPSVDPAIYEVGDEVLEAFSDEALGGAVARPGPRAHLDLAQVVANQLLHVGLLAEHLEAAPCSTGPATGFFSDRAARPCGRLGLLALLHGGATS